MTNLRQVIQGEMKKRKLTCNCLRCREVGHQENLEELKGKEMKLFIDEYDASDGKEYFLSFEDKKKRSGLCFLSTSN